jgi:hypothetical protein
MMSAGDHQVTFNAGTLPTGVYMTVLETPSGSLSKPMLLLK